MCWNCLEFYLCRLKVRLKAVIWISWIVSPAFRRPEFDICSVHWGCAVHKLFNIHRYVHR